MSLTGARIKHEVQEFCTKMDPFVAVDFGNVLFLGIEQIDFRHANRSDSPRSLRRACWNSKCYPQKKQYPVSTDSKHSHDFRKHCAAEP